MRLRVRSAGFAQADHTRHAEARSGSSQHEGFAWGSGREGSSRLSKSRRVIPAFHGTGPVQAEVFVLRMADGRIELAGPCGPDPWYVEVGAKDDPVEVVARLSRNLMGEPLLVHSTSWRRARGSVILSFVVVNADNQALHLAGIPTGRAELARSAPTSAAKKIAANQVLEHGLRHLAWLARDDEVVRKSLSDDWKRVLAGYVPEPFRHMD